LLKNKLLKDIITFDNMHFLFHYSNSVFLSIMLSSCDLKGLAGVEIGNAYVLSNVTKKLNSIDTEI